MRNYLAALCVLTTFAGCSGDPHVDYVGVWQAPGNPPKTIEIRKDGDSFVFQDLRATAFFSDKKEGPRVLSIQGAQLTISNGIGNMPIGLSGDKNTLLFADLSFARVAKSDEQKVKQDIENQHTQRADRKSKCEDLRREAKEKENKINRSNVAAGEKLKSMAAMKSEIMGRASNVVGCNSGLLFY